MKTDEQWYCEEHQQWYSKADFIEHLKTHGIDPQTAKGNRQMTMHMDGSNWWQSTYQWTLGDLHFTQSIRSEREKNDPMMFHEPQP